MMRRSSDLFGKPVVSADSGEKLGTVADLLFDDDGGTFVGLVLRQGLLKSESVLPAEAVQTLGADAIVARSRELIGAKEWHLQQAPRQAHRESRDIVNDIPRSIDPDR